MSLFSRDNFSVSLRHGSKYTRHIVLSAVASRQRLAGRFVRDRRGEQGYKCKHPFFEGGGECCGQAFPDIRFPSAPHMAASGFVAVQDIYHSPYSPVLCGWQDFELGSSLVGCWGTYDFDARKKTIDTLLETKSQTATARLLRLTFDQVHHVMERAVTFGLIHRSKIKSHNHIHIDEKSVHGRDFASIVYDDDATVLEVVDGRKKEDAKRLINNALTPIQQANVLTVSMDMWDPFRDAVRELMPMAAICHDPFHLVTHLNAAVDGVRRREVRTQKELKRKRYLFLKDKAGFTDRQQLEFDAIVKANYLTAQAWRIKEEFRDIIKGRYDRAEASTLYSMWRLRAVNAQIPEITRVVEMFDRHRKGIINAIYMQHNNGKAERMNGSIQELKTIGRGYRDVERFRIAILFFYGGLTLHKDFIMLNSLS